MEETFDVSNLAEGLSGIAPSEDFEACLPVLHAGAHVTSALREAPYASLGPLLAHLSEVVGGIVATRTQALPREKSALNPMMEKVQALCFAISSAVGTCRLKSGDESQLWNITKSLWASHSVSLSLSLPFKLNQCPSVT